MIRRRSYTVRRRGSGAAVYAYAARPTWINAESTGPATAAILDENGYELETEDA